MRIIVCGGRYYSNKDRVFETLDALQDRVGSFELMHGGARGADALAHDWWWDRGLGPCEPMPADWETHGRAAGPIRNQLMLDEHKPDLVIAFAGGRGTADMVRRAEAAGVEVQHVE